jgi:hypothetical protein
VRRRQLAILTLCLPLACVLGGDDDEGDDQVAATDTGGSTGTPMADDGTGDEGPGGCFNFPECDPLSPDCGDGQVCIPGAVGFSCAAMVEPGAPIPAGEACGGPATCGPGLACLPATVPGCEGGVGCCVPICELSAPQCGDAGTCMPFYASAPPPCFEDVGVCLIGG